MDLRSSERIAAEAGSLGVFALGSLGAFIEGQDGAFVVSDSNGTGLQAHVGIGSSAPIPPANTALFASVSATSQVGLEARGRVRFPNRSGRAMTASSATYVAWLVLG
jgi:hypothetical protein